MDDPTDVRTRHDLAAFVEGLALEFRAHPEQWENATLPEYLDALARYLGDLHGWCLNHAPEIDPESAQWWLFAVALSGATVYE